MLEYTSIILVNLHLYLINKSDKQIIKAGKNLSDKKHLLNEEA
jgi:hypothetical protein